MAENSFQEKSEKATPKRRKEAREKGQVAKSVEVTSTFVLLASLGVFFFSGSWMFLKIQLATIEIFGHLGEIHLENAEESKRFIVMVLENIFIILSPLFMAVVVFGFIGNLAQIGFEFSSKQMAPKFNKLNPISGLKRLVSIRSFVELIKSVLKIIIVGIVAFLTVKKEMINIPFLIGMDVYQILSFLGITSLKICFVTGLVLILLAALDFGFQKYQHEKDLKMTFQEVKEESKQTEGDPKIKQRIRAAQLEMVRRRMIHAVPEATVVITNPTHLAIAIKFEFGKMGAPQVVAKGAGVLAAQIRKLAKANDVPIVENKPLARLMFKTVEIGDFIPTELYQAVAEILAYIYRLKGKM
ncbi:MAG: flagellar biosynthesis protein FlhB [Desulfobacteraceae bacterium]|nr:flagellar biosynthesis protein FlhB [Desulfobacteraceae bacterium]